MRELALLTAGGHSLDVAAIARESGWAPVFYDDDPHVGLSARWEGRTPLPRPMSDLPADEPFAAVIGHNEPAQRFEVAVRYPHAVWQSLFHKSVVGWPELWEDGCVVAAGAVITERVTLGYHVHVNVGATISQATTIGDFCTISPGANVCGDISIGARTWVGAGAVIKDHVSVGSDVLIGCGAVVISDVPDGSTVVGNPARPLVRAKPEDDAGFWRQLSTAQDRLVARGTT